MPPGDQPCMGVPDSCGCREGPSILTSKEDDLNDPAILEEVREWKTIADELKLVGYPQHLGTSLGVSRFSDDIRQKAHKLDQFLERCFDGLGANDKDDGVDTALHRLHVLICQGLSISEFTKLMAEHNFSLKCTLIWEQDSIAYRCNTCALTPCMSLCAGCFNNADHEGHDVTRFFSREGGACDCGNADVMRENGFCQQHGENAARPPPPPATIISLAELVLLRVVMRIIDRFRRFDQLHPDATYPVHLNSANIAARLYDGGQCDAGKLIAFLHRTIEYGGPIRDVMSQMLINTDIYSMLTERETNDDRWCASFKDFRDGYDAYERRRLKVFSLEALDTFFPSFDGDKMRTTCMLHELLFWLQRNLYPQPLVNIFLALLSDSAYQHVFANGFFSLYPFTAELMRVICNTDEVSYTEITHVSSRIIHVSVQMLSSGALCAELCDSISLPLLMYGTLAYILLENLRTISVRPLRREIKKAPTPPPAAVEAYTPPAVLPAGPMVVNVTTVAEGTRTPTPPAAGDEQAEEGMVEGEDQPGGAGDDEQEMDVDDEGVGSSVTSQGSSSAPSPSVARPWTVICGERNRSVKQHGYWFAMGDIQNLLSHGAVVAKMCADPRALDMYFLCISKMQCMNTIERIVSGDHILNEQNDEYQRTLILEYEMASNSMYNLVFNLVGSNDDAGALAMYDACWKYIMDWIGAMDVVNAGYPLQLSKKEVTFHIPLSRHLSTLLFYGENLPSLRKKLDELSTKTSKTILHALLLHPLRIHAARIEWTTHMWVRNGSQMRIPTILYSQTQMLNAFYIADIDLMRFLCANMPTSDVLHAIFDAYSMGDVFRWKRKTGSSGVSYHSDVALILRRIEWVDTLAFGCLKLISELIVLRNVAEMSERESLMENIIAMLALGQQPYSRLRSSISEKGSRGAEVIDQLFEGVLAEVSDFKDADQDDSLGQGLYSLSERAMIDQFCPVLLYSRCYQAKTAATAISTMLDVERRLAGRMEYDSKDLWTPYRLLSFEDELKRRQHHSKGIYALLLNDRLLETACYMLEQYKNDSFVLEARLMGVAPSELPHEFLFKEQTIQLVIYLLSLAVLYATSHPEEEAARLLDRFHADLGDQFATDRTLAGTIISFGSVIMVMGQKMGEVSREEQNKRVHAAIREALTYEVKDRLLAGTPAEYYGRLLVLLYRVDPKFREMVEAKYPPIVVEPKAAESETPAVSDGTPNTVLAKKRAAAEALKRRIMDDKKKKGNLMMQKLMEKEGMSQNDLDQLDVADKSVELYECPICCDETPCSLEQPVGLLARFQTNDSFRNQIDFNTDVVSLLDLDMMEMQERASNPTKRENCGYAYHEPFWRRVRAKLAMALAGPHSDLVSCPLSFEMKTCGHHAHFSCMQQYRATLVATRPHHAPIMYCPKCRFPSNCLLPLKMRAGLELNQVDKFRKMDRSAPHAIYDLLIKQLAMSEGVVNKMEKWEKMSELIAKHMGQVFQQKPGDLAEVVHQRAHAALTSLIKVNIERNLFFDQTAVTPLRPKCADLVTPHLAFYSSLMINKEDFGVLRSHVKELFMEEPSGTHIDANNTIGSSMQMEIPRSSPRRDDEGDEEDDDDDFTPRAHFMPVVPPDEEILASTSSNRMRVDDPILKIADVRACLPYGLSDRMVIRSFNRGRAKSSDYNMRISYSHEWKSRFAKNKVEEFDAQLPAVFVEPLLQMIRLTSLLLTSELNKETILEVLPLVTRRVLAMAAVRAHMFELLRTRSDLLMKWALEWEEAAGGPETEDQAMDSQDDEPSTSSSGEGAALGNAVESMVTLKDNSAASEGQQEVMDQSEPPYVDRHLDLLIECASSEAQARADDKWSGEEGTLTRRSSSIIGLRNVVARTMLSNDRIRNCILSARQNSAPDDNTDSQHFISDPVVYERAISGSLHVLMQQTAQLWHELQLKPLPQGVRSGWRLTLEQLNAHLFGDDGTMDIPTDYVVGKWINNATFTLAYLFAEKKTMFMKEPTLWKPFQILPLPDNYDDLFSRYFGRTCRMCNTVPSTPLVCLLCSDLLCLDDCCSHANGPNEENRIREVELHPCGGASCLYMALNSGIVVIVRQSINWYEYNERSRGGLWGSVYLDAHGEEDRNLRRGKPLKLSPKRVERLYRDWVEGDIEGRVNFYSLSHLPGLIRDSHYRL